MEQIRILLAAPYAELKDIALEVRADFPQIQLEVFVGNLAHAIDYIREYPEDRFDLIISRGGTAQMVQEFVSIPVVDIHISAYDVLRSVKLAELCSQHFAIVAYSSIAYAGKVLCSILRYDDLEVLEAYTSEETTAHLEHLRESGVDLIIGDVNTVEAAEAMGMRGLLVTSSTDDVRLAFQSAVQLYESIHGAHARARLLEKMLDETGNGIALYDTNGALCFSNRAFTSLLQNGLRESVQSQLPVLGKKESVHLLQCVGDQLFEIRGKQMQCATSLYYLLQVDAIGKGPIPNDAVECESAVESSKNMHFLFSTSEYVRPLIAQLDAISKSSSPVLITGEIGTEKASAARYIHRNSAWKDAPFITVHCSLLTEKNWNCLTERIHSPLYLNGCTVFFENVHMLPLPLQITIHRFFCETRLDTRNRILASFAADVHEMVAKGQFYRPLYNTLYGLTVHMPSLSEHVEDIPSIAGQYVSRYNMLLGKEVTGFDEKALSLLKQQKWALNLDQFQRVIRHLVELSDDSCITAEEVESALKAMSYQTVGTTLDLTKTLDEIESDIIAAVLNDENMNQTMAAKRLGISRSTLWRKLGAYQKS